MNVIEVQNAVKKYESHSVLDNLCMRVKRGSIYALMGSSGCGKTTLLSCIVGTKTLDSGSLKVFNNSVGKNKLKVGYMPQELALVDEFTIKELVHFFGAVYGLSQTRIVERLSFMVKLMELEDATDQIKNCSGGQKRRISLALCLVHQPELLILDEPTVGLDPVLRFKIWDFLETVTKSGQTTVLITTHYIEEAKQANCVGLLRHGALVAEDSPVNLLSAFGTSNLETAFLKLCELQQERRVTPRRLSKTNELVERTRVGYEAEETSIGKKAIVTVLKIKALMRKNFIQMLRRPAVLGFLLFTPFLCLVSFYLTIGSDPIGLKIGIVNNEIGNFSECDDPLLLKTTIVDFNCYTNKISCRFINSINESVATKVYYHHYQDAYDEVKRGKLIGLVYFSSNFTSSMKPLNELEGFIENYTTNGEIQIHLDQSDRQLFFFIKQRLYETFENFIETLMVDCGKSRRVGSSPIQFNTMFGSLKDEARKSMTPGIIISIYFFLGSMLTSAAFVSDRVDGIWNRVLLAGVIPFEILVSHVLSNSFVILLQTIEFFIVTTYIYDLDNKGDSRIVLALLLLIGLSAILYGLGVSIIAKDVVAATFMSSLIFYPLMIMCGIFWPIEAIPWYFRYLAYCLPFTLPTVALRDILYKGFTLANHSVQVGFSMVFVWILLSLAICFLGLRKKRFCAS